MVPGRIRCEGRPGPGYTPIPMNTDETTEASSADSAPARSAGRRLLLGLGIIVFSFAMSGFAVFELGWAGTEEACGHHVRALYWTEQAAYLYGASWIMLGIGILIGGKPAYSMFVAHRKRVVDKLLRRKPPNVKRRT